MQENSKASNARKPSKVVLKALQHVFGEAYVSTLSPLLSRANTTLASKIIVRDHVADIHADLANYALPGAYQCMVNDVNRNKFFEQSINCWASQRPLHVSKTRASRTRLGKEDGALRESVALPPSTEPWEPLIRWLELGPGLEGTLTSMVLEANPQTKIVAVEAVEEVAKGLWQKLKGKYQNRFEVSAKA